jgi:hypothetical protein
MQSQQLLSQPLLPQPVENILIISHTIKSETTSNPLSA